MSSSRESKVCVVCGRPFEWRRKWAENWDEVRYCSDRCRRSKRFGGEGGAGRAIEASIDALLDQREAGKSICPSEAAQRVADRGVGDVESWRDLMEPTRAAARRMAYDGRLEITQDGRMVDPAEARGPIRLRRPRG